jgi:hypothetical protein
MGEERGQSIFFLNGKEHKVRENLFNALINLRHKSEWRVLWIDALCISQDDVNERNHQVSQMAGIYSQAKRVVAWVRQSDDSTFAALDFMKSITADQVRWYN